MSDRICPYPGLRPFQEDEAIFFQGREENVATISTVLEQNRFLMLAGSSGDGKSSLVFAGLIPHCRAGFFRAAYPSWGVAVFRPERSPLHQLAKALAEVLGLEADPVENTLRHGFSALVDLYLSSAAVGGAEEEASEKRQLAASQNLLIVADQFEELFTNPENFVAGAPSQEARLCVNILLETARLALEHDLPIYVVCTMRSDYIGQCNAFSGLPEMIGFSHYFVPRLTRSQLRRVVLEPARLNGDDIAPRLAERLIYDLQEGEDQLPLLQHALASIWREADIANAPLDLLAYYRCGGISTADLPKEDKTDGFVPIIPLVEDGTEAYGLEAVLNRHAGELFRQATEAEYSPRAEWQLARAFTCLTGQDNGRMVRNRMSIRQIAQTIEADPAGWPALEGALIRMFVPFRDMSAGFVRPLLMEGEPETLTPDTVLDITHEALIRNWDSLREWTMTEHRRLLTWRELEPQVRRWAEARTGARAGSAYLLPIGPLNYFEDWQDETRPTAFWMARYASPEGGDKGRMDEGKQLETQTTEFLRRSARRLALTRFVSRVGALRIVGTLVGVVLVAALAVGLWKRYQASNDVVLRKAQARAEKAFYTPLADRGTKSVYLLNAYAAEVQAGKSPEQATASILGLVRREESDSLRVGTALDGARQFLQFFTTHDHPAVRGLMAYADSVATSQKTWQAWTFRESTRLHGFWKGLHFLSGDQKDKQLADSALIRVRTGLEAYLSHPEQADNKALAVAIVYHTFSDLSDTERIGQWVDIVDPEKPLTSGLRADSLIRSLFDPAELENDVLIRCGKFLCNRLDYFTEIERIFLVGNNLNKKAVFDPVKFFLCQSGAAGGTVQQFQNEMLRNFETGDVTPGNFASEVFPALLMAGNPMQLVAPGSLPTHAFWGDLFADPGTVLSASLLTSGTYRGFLINTELLLNNTVGQICKPEDTPACELAMGKFLFEYSAPYSIDMARRSLLEGLRTIPASMPKADVAHALSDSVISPAYLPAYHALVGAAMPGVKLDSKVQYSGPVDPVTTVTCLSIAGQRQLDSLTAKLDYNTFPNPVALLLARWANPQTSAPLQPAILRASPKVQAQLVAHARQALLATDSTLPKATSRQDSLAQVADMHNIQQLLAHRQGQLPVYNAALVPRGDEFGKAAAALAAYMVINDEEFSRTARRAVSQRQIEAENTEALRLHMVDLYALSRRYWPAYRELENVYSAKSELYLLNNLLFDAMDLRSNSKPELAYYYRRYLLGNTSVGMYR